MKRALLLAMFAVGCTPTVLLGTLVGDGGGVDLAPGCLDCDLARPPDALDFGKLGDGGDLGGSDLGDGSVLVDLAH